ILLTPDERLSKQHLDELENSGFTQYQLFDKSKSAPFKGTIEVPVQVDLGKQKRQVLKIFHIQHGVFFAITVLSYLLPVLY
ncbi:hypothetical protein, partial [Escherichia coli]|uniref:hypothetical protein n=1 Tax=Escherichia coli TaxID=562 RepID=UPI003EE4147F